MTVTVETLTRVHSYFYMSRPYTKGRSLGDPYVQS